MKTNIEKFYAVILEKIYSNKRSFRDPLWFKRNFLCEKCKEDVAYAEEELIKVGKDPADPGRIVAENKFG